MPKFTGLSAKERQAEAITNIKEAIQLYIEVLDEKSSILEELL